MTLLLVARHGVGETRADAGSEVESRAILLVRTAGDDAVMNRVRVELRAYGWRVIEVSHEDGTTIAESLTTLASEQVATAAVRVDANTGQIEIFIGRPWGNVEETLRSEDGQIDGQVLALRTTEALRAHGLDLGPEAMDAAPAEDSHALTSEPPVSRESKPPNGADATRIKATAPAAAKRVEESLQPSSRGIWLQVAPTIIGSPGGMGLGIAGWMGLRFELSPIWSISATGVLPVTSHLVSEPQGRASVSSGLLGVSTGASWLRRSFGSAAVGLGAAALVTSMKGTQSQPGYRNASDTVITIAPYSYLHIGGVLGPNWQAFALVLVGTSFPEVTVAFDERPVRTWGSFFALLGMGIEMHGIRW